MRCARLLAPWAKAMRWTDGFIAVDWGTTNRRAYRFDASGDRVDEFEDAKGVLSIAAGGFPAAVAEIRERLGDLPLLLAGMIGSNRGWVEAPYVPCPAAIEELAEGSCGRASARLSFPASHIIGEGRADVMRGEEVQLLGGVAAGLVDPMTCLFAIRGRTTNGSLLAPAFQSFRTVMTGELFNLLKEHSILPTCCRAGRRQRRVQRGRSCTRWTSDMLPAELFWVRARVLLGKAKGGRTVLHQRAAHRHRCADWPYLAGDGAGWRHGPAGAHTALCSSDC